MAALEVTITGVLYDKVRRTTQQVVLIGEASLTGFSIGGGPSIPPEKPIGQPPGIWGPTDPRPGYGLPDIPPIPSEPPPNPSEAKAPPPDGGWGWVPEHGWGYFPKPQV